MRQSVLLGVPSFIYETDEPKTAKADEKEDLNTCTTRFWMRLENVYSA